MAIQFHPKSRILVSVESGQGTTQNYYHNFGFTSKDSDDIASESIENRRFRVLTPLSFDATSPRNSGMFPLD